MAVKIIDSRGLASYYQCLTTDVKPTSNVPDGATLIELNATTNKIAAKYIMHDGTWFKED